MNFVSMQEMYDDMTAWERQLPVFDAVCGVPRSGLLPASYIAMRRNIRLVELTDLLKQPEGAIARAPLRSSNPIIKYKREYKNRLLIVDDSSSTNSVTFTDLREKLKDQTSLDIKYGVLYRGADNGKVDYHYRDVTLPRVFGWNWYRHWWIQFAYFDMDGVICEDWKGDPEQDKDPAFLNHVKTAQPLYIPHLPIKAVVTSRLERYRAETEDWLRRHNVHYGSLIMHPAKSPDERRRMMDHAKRKAKVYAADRKGKLFVESDIRQAREINKITSRPVLCVDTMEMLN